MHKNEIPTERVLCVIEFPGNLSINVRAGTNLLRPSHFFNHLKQSNLSRLKASIDFFINRQLSNSDWKPLARGENRYKRLLTEVSRSFAEMAARFEVEYIFCWLAWDGDNILTNGGIIDYGSIRQFGLFHHEYKFDDVDRWSTSIPEQRAQARYLVQTFAQIEHYINTGKKLEIGRFRNHPEVRKFDKTFTDSRRRMMLEKSGFTRHDAETLMAKSPKLVTKYEAAYKWWERKTKQKKHYRVADGITKDALYSMRDILRELPRHLANSWSPMPVKEFMAAIASTYCGPSDARPTMLRSHWAAKFQTAYMNLVSASARHQNARRDTLIAKMTTRSEITNRRERVTGDAICSIGDKIIRSRKQLERRQLFHVIKSFIDDQTLVPEAKSKGISRATIPDRNQTAKTETVLKALGKVVRDMRHGL